MSSTLSLVSSMGQLVTKVLLQVEELKTRFITQQGILNAVNGVTFSLKHGETLALVGESGSGKTVTVLSLLRLLPKTKANISAKKINFDGENLLDLKEDDLRTIRGTRIGTIFQNPVTSLNPVLTIGRQLSETLEIHKGVSSREAWLTSAAFLEEVGISNATNHMNDYPHQFSGGMCQRVMIAMALMSSPQLLIAEEPTTALDVTTQAQIMQLVSNIQASKNMAMIWISHDLNVVSHLADHIAVMYSGFIVEYGNAQTLLTSPQHPYTRNLLSAAPDLSGPRKNRLDTLGGQAPNPLTTFHGCQFADRCSFVMEKCRSETPHLHSINPEHQLACWWDIDTNCERLY